MENGNILDESTFDARRSSPRNNTVGKGKRFANMIIDSIILTPIAMFIGWQFLEIDYDTGETSGNAMFQLVYYLLFLGYYFFLEGSTGQTLGKMVTGTKVVDEHGDKPSLGNIAGRSLCRIIPFEAFSFFGPKTIGWHDSISNTYVVPKDWQVESTRDDILDSM